MQHGLTCLLGCRSVMLQNKLIEKEVGVREGELNEGGQKIQTSAYKINKY